MSQILDRLADIRTLMNCLYGKRNQWSSKKPHSWQKGKISIRVADLRVSSSATRNKQTPK